MKSIRNFFEIWYLLLLFSAIIKNHSPVESHTRVHNFIIANNQIAIEAAIQQAQTLGYDATQYSKEIVGDVKIVADLYANLVRNSLPLSVSSKSHICLISGGETTVQVKGHGEGGRNQELALRFSLFCKKHNLKNVFLLCGGTDGIDGPTSAAG